MPEQEAFAPESWCRMTFVEQRELLARELAARLPDDPAIRGVTVEAGSAARPYDLTAVVETDVGRLRAPLWSDARAKLFCDTSVHEANRLPHGPQPALDQTAAELRPRLGVRFTLEARGLSFSLELEEGVVRTWTAEHARFRKRTAVTREDRVERPGDVDVRDLLAHFYSGPSLRLVGDDGAAFLLPAAADVEGPLVTLCRKCGRWAEGERSTCGECGSEAVDLVVAARPGRR